MNRPRTLLVTLGLVLLAASPGGLAAARPHASSTRRAARAVGAWINPDDQTGGWSQAETLQFEALIGRTLAIDHHYRGWSEGWWPSSRTGAEVWDVHGGRTPLDSWEGPPSLDVINDGSQDANIAAAARRVKAFGHPLFLRPMWEMNGAWEPWSGSKNNSPDRVDGPAKFVRAWRRIHRIFVENGAANVIWVWSPNADDVPHEPWNHWTKYYPGDAYVDWIAADGYNWGTTASWSHWRPFASIFRRIYREYAARKPFMIAETASVEQGGRKAAWIAKSAAAVKTRFSRVRAFLWFDATEQEMSRDRRVNSSPASLQAFRALAADRYFRARFGSTKGR